MNTIHRYEPRAEHGVGKELARTEFGDVALKTAQALAEWQCPKEERLREHLSKYPAVVLVDDDGRRTYYGSRAVERWEVGPLEEAR